MKKFYCIFFILIWFSNCIWAQNYQPSNNILYVKKGSNGNGSSWNNAIGELADALKWAKLNKDSSETKPLQIWVSAGVYKPMYSPEDNKFGISANRNNTFLMVQNVSLFGHFMGNETSINQRNLDNLENATILSGDLNDDDIILKKESTNFYEIKNNDENVYHVILQSKNISNKIKLDGFTIANGNANGNYSFKVGNIDIFQFYGAGIYSTSNENTTVTLNNMIIKNNVAAEDGGGIYIRSNKKACILNIDKSNITNNFALNGAGIFSISEESNSITIDLNQTKINNNNALENGGGIFANSFISSNIIVNNSEINNNKAQKGGAIYSFTSDITINSSNVIKNRSIGAFYFSFGDNNEITIHNSILYKNKSQVENKENSWISGIDNQTKVNIDIKNSWIHNYLVDHKIDSDISSATDPLFTDESKNDYSLLVNSPLKNNGNKNLSNNATKKYKSEKDLANNKRIIASNIDIGAYENQCEIKLDSNVKHVTCFGAKNGSITVEATFGKAPYSYLWNDEKKQTTKSINNLTAGTYSCLVTDAKGCSEILTQIITEPKTDFPLSITNQKYTRSQNAKISDIKIIDEDIIWFDKPENGKILNKEQLLENGKTYYAKYSSNEMCSETYIPVTITLFEDSEIFEQDHLRYFPNPVSDILYITYIENIQQIEVYDLNGKIVKLKKTDDLEVNINCLDLPSGIYIVQVKSKNKQQFFKITKK